MNGQAQGQWLSLPLYSILSRSSCQYSQTPACIPFTRLHPVHLLASHSPTHNPILCQSDIAWTRLLAMTATAGKRQCTAGDFLCVCPFQTHAHNPTHNPILCQSGITFFFFLANDIACTLSTCNQWPVTRISTCNRWPECQRTTSELLFLSNFHSHCTHTPMLYQSGITFYFCFWQMTSLAVRHQCATGDQNINLQPVTRVSMHDWWVTFLVKLLLTSHSQPHFFAKVTFRASSTNG